MYTDKTTGHHGTTAQQPLWSSTVHSMWWNTVRGEREGQVEETISGGEINLQSI